MGKLGDPNPSDPNIIPGNPPKSILGGDNRKDLGRNRIPGNPDTNVIPHDYGRKGDDRHLVEGNITPEQLKSMMRGGDSPGGAR